MCVLAGRGLGAVLVVAAAAGVGVGAGAAGVEEVALGDAVGGLVGLVACGVERVPSLQQGKEGGGGRGQGKERIGEDGYVRTSGKRR